MVRPPGMTRTRAFDAAARWLPALAGSLAARPQQESDPGLVAPPNSAATYPADPAAVECPGGTGY
jgi:hypothetical protein